MVDRLLSLKLQKNLVDFKDYYNFLSIICKLFIDTCINCDCQSSIQKFFLKWWPCFTDNPWHSGWHCSGVPTSSWTTLQKGPQNTDGGVSQKDYSRWWYKVEIFLKHLKCLIMNWNKEIKLTLWNVIMYYQYTVYRVLLFPAPITFVFIWPPVGGHDSQEDAISCMELMQWRVKEDARKEPRCSWFL